MDLDLTNDIDLATNDFNLGDLDLSNFSDKMLDTATEFESRYMKPPLSVERSESYYKYEHAIDLAQKLFLKKNERQFYIINGSFIFGDFIEAWITERNFHVKKMTISTLSLSQNNVDSLRNLVDGGFVDELNLIVSDYFFSHERKALIPYIYQELDKPGINKFQLAVCGTHCKTCIFETHNGGFIVIHGSATLRTSANLEQFMIEENEALYRFNDDYQKKIIDEYKTINKALRVNKLWNVIK
jgi:hypothetical protein